MWKISGWKNSWWAFLSLSSTMVGKLREKLKQKGTTRRRKVLRWIQLQGCVLWCISGSSSLLGAFLVFLIYFHHVFAGEMKISYLTWTWKRFLASGRWVKSRWRSSEWNFSWDTYMCVWVWIFPTQCASADGFMINLLLSCLALLALLTQSSLRGAIETESVWEMLMNFLLMLIFKLFMAMAKPSEFYVQAQHALLWLSLNNFLIKSSSRAFVAWCLLDQIN